MPTFSKRHYELLATIMQDACPEKNWDPNKRAQGDVTVTRMREHLKRDNPAFKSERFAVACEPGNNVKART